MALFALQHLDQWCKLVNTVNCEVARNLEDFDGMWGRPPGSVILQDYNGTTTTAMVDRAAVFQGKREGWLETEDCLRPSEAD